jgi:isopentenyl phosphate kinase
MLVFLKLGGSLITDKTSPSTPRLETLERLAEEIAAAFSDRPDMRLVLGHGSGSFGHTAAKRHGTRQGVSGPKSWHGFADVWYQASELNRLVLQALRKSGLPALTLSPLASILADAGRVAAWDLTQLESSLEHGLLPVVHGDVVFDRERGGTILSTEELFGHLAERLRPQRILLAGMEAGVWADFPQRARLIEAITPSSFTVQLASLGASAGTDVTGGMLAKVSAMLPLLESLPELEVLIFSGEQPGNIRRALAGESPGTRLHC